MDRLLSPASLLLVFSFFLASCANEPSTILFLYIEVCPACESYDRAAAIEARVLALQSRRQEASTFNFAHIEDESVLHQVLKGVGIDPNNVEIPVLFHNGETELGYDEIEGWLDSIEQ